MSKNIIGLDALLKDFDIMGDKLDNCLNYIAKETATMILSESVENVSGPKNPNWKKSKTSKSNSTTSNKSMAKIVKRFLSNLKIVDKNDVPYPVSVNTGTLRRSLKLRKISKGSYKVFADSNIANYAYWVHEGTSRMQSRPFLDDAVDKVLNDGKYLDVAAEIVEKAIDK